jgi:phospholipase C
VFGPANGLPKNDPNALPGGCTRDLVHRYYQDPYQENGGLQNRYVTGSDAIGLTMGNYNTKALPIYKYLHDRGHPDYTILDDFFQGAFGGSFLNHQWLITTEAPVWLGALNDGSADDLHSVFDSNGMPNNYPLYASPLGGNVKDQQLTQSCSPAASRPPFLSAFACGNYAVNTSQPFVQPFSPGTAVNRRMPLLPPSYVTIGDELTYAGVDWAWYSGGWSNANGYTTKDGYTNGSGPTCSDPNHNTSASVAWPVCPDGLFQFHHQPFNYYANYATSPGRDHLQDEVTFENLAQSSDHDDCNLKPVSFIKPIGEENEHPGYASLPTGSTHLVDLLSMIEDSGCAKNTMVVVTYDEFGGQWDHVSSPGSGTSADGTHDIWGPGTRIPAIVLAPHLHGNFSVDSNEHDTTSIMATIEHRYGLDPIGTRDAAVNDLSTVFSARRPQT